MRVAQLGCYWAEVTVGAQAGDSVHWNFGTAAGSAVNDTYCEWGKVCVGYDAVVRSDRSIAFTQGDGNTDVWNRTTALARSTTHCKDISGVYTDPTVTGATTHVVQLHCAWAAVTVGTDAGGWAQWNFGTVETTDELTDINATYCEDRLCPKHYSYKGSFQADGTIWWTNPDDPTDTDTWTRVSAETAGFSK